VVYYIAHRLFAAHDRALAACLAQRLAAKVGPERVFLPFCDTDEEQLVAEVKGRRLFELDRERLDHLEALIAILHGPSLDDGVCMEIGYAAASGVPVTVVTTDFQTYSLTEDGPRLAFPDPLIEAVATHVVRFPGLAARGTVELPEPDRFSVFLDRTLAQLHAALDAAVSAGAGPPGPPAFRAAPSAVEQPTVFIEPSRYSDPDDLAAVCLAANHEVSLPKRFTTPSLVPTALSDITAACAASRLLVDVSGPETPPGAALLIGAAAARGMRIAAYHPRPTFTHAHGREPNWRNLMVQYAVETRLDSHTAVLSWLAG
jgi:nucleoside 2-deoxyribosyltransferase-like protein